MGHSIITACGRGFARDGKEIVFNGIGLGAWLNMEHFMLGIPGTDRQIRRCFEIAFGREKSEAFFDDFVTSFVAERDFVFLKEHHINLVRVPFNYRLFIEDSTGNEKTAGFKYLDYLMSLANKYEIYVLPDLHAAPGGQNPDWHSDNGTGYTEFWEYKVFQDEICVLWGKIAARYKNNPYLLGYDILNEPFLIPEGIEAEEDSDDMATGVRVMGGDAKLRDFYSKAIASIRTQDTEHLIFLEGDHFASDFDCLDGIIDDKLAYEFHFYPTVWCPDLYEDRYTRKERFKKFDEVLKKLMKEAGKTGRPVLCGEAGYEIKTQGFDHVFPLIEDTIKLFRKYDLSFTLWSYKDAGFMGIVYPKQYTPWMRLATEIEKNWNHHKEMEEAERAVSFLCDDTHKNATRQERYVMSFRQRAFLYPLEEKYVLLPTLRNMRSDELHDLAESFCFTNCDYYERFAELFDM